MCNYARRWTCCDHASSTMKDLCLPASSSNEHTVICTLRVNAEFGTHAECVTLRDAHVFHACRHPDQRSGHPPPPPSSHPHRPTSPGGSHHSADHGLRDPRTRTDNGDRSMLNGDVHRGVHEPNPRASHVQHDGHHADVHHAGRQLEQLSIATSQAPKVTTCNGVSCHLIGNGSCCSLTLVCQVV